MNGAALRPAFILSFDCEGKWGMMDHLEGEHARLSSAGLEAAYRSLCALLERHRIKATFAFVGAFSMSEEELRAKLSLFREVGERTRRWLAPFLADLEAGRTDGWLAPGALSAVRKAGAHELGSHGFSHLPLVEGEIDRGEFLRELGGVFKTEAFAGERELTLVYPRNQVGFKEELVGCGFVGYRDTLAPRKDERTSQWRHLFDELDPSPRAQAHADPPGAGEAAAIPSGRFLNWRSGPRANIPISWTASRWRRRLDDAVRCGGVAHAWSHPHNFVTGRGMFDLLEEILKAASARVRAGELWNPTMREYALALRGAGAP